MKSVFVVLCWLLLGFFFWTMSKSCCQSGKVANSVAVVTDKEVQDSNSIIVAPPDTSNFVATENDMDSNQTATSAPIDYDYEADKTIVNEGGISAIPLKEENTFNDEIKAQLEQYCARMQNDLSKIYINGYDNGDKLARKTTMKMENFLIICGVSPSRVVRTNRITKDERNSHIQMYIK